MPLTRVLADLSYSSGARNEQNKTDTFGCGNTAGGSFHIFLAPNGFISHLYYRFQSVMVQGFLK
jgi:hypothetical protein